MGQESVMSRQKTSAEKVVQRAYEALANEFGSDVLYVERDKDDLYGLKIRLSRDLFVENIDYTKALTIKDMLYEVLEDEHQKAIRKGECDE